MVSGSVSTSSAECFSPFPHGTGTLSVSRECLALPDGPGGFRRDYTCPALLRMPRGGQRLRLRGYHPLRRRFPGGLASPSSRRKRGPLQPRGRPKTPPVWAPPLSLATTRGIIGLFSLPAGTKMFQFPAFASPTKKRGYRQSRWVVPFGDPRIKGHLRLPADYRSLSRPSSPPRAKASAMRPRITSTPPAKGREAVNLRSCLCRLSKIDRRNKRRGGKGRRPGRSPRKGATWTERGDLSRKEVFQPHLPVRLPCYDLAPITGIALGRPSRSRTSGAPGFHGLTGGVYKARERIHRAMADARLLANPASWGRVADPSPN